MTVTVPLCRVTAVTVSLRVTVTVSLCWVMMAMPSRPMMMISACQSS
jgi:hypothetical protein